MWEKLLALNGGFLLLKCEGILYPLPRGKWLTEVWGHHFPPREWKYHSSKLKEEKIPFHSKLGDFILYSFKYIHQKNIALKTHWNEKKINGKEIRNAAHIKYTNPRGIYIYWICHTKSVSGYFVLQINLWNLWVSVVRGLTEVIL